MERAALVVAGLVVVGCAAATNYTSPTGPRYGGAPQDPMPSRPAPKEFVVATFNIERGVEVDAALRLIAETEPLRKADVLLLQEVDERGSERVATALGMAWVYYPARESRGRGFGNAVLSRWPIEEDAKLILPHRAWLNDSQRTATMAVLRVGEEAVRVYSVHVATIVNQSLPDRQDQLRAVLDDAGGHDRVVVGGDLNSEDLAEVAVARGYDWPTEEGPGTSWIGRIDHVLLRGFTSTSDAEAGTVEDLYDASDHKPVWVRIRFRSPG